MGPRRAWVSSIASSNGVAIGHVDVAGDEAILPDPVAQALQPPSSDPVPVPARRRPAGALRWPGPPARGAGDDRHPSLNRSTRGGHTLEPYVVWT